MKGILTIGLVLLLAFPIFLKAQEAKSAPSAADLAKKLSNPVASLISVPFQNNFYAGIGENNGTRHIMNVQPVIPISVAPKWNLISRVIVPVVRLYNINGEGSRESGLGDILGSAFFSPKESKNGLTWGAGPVFMIPTATNNLTGTGKFGIGPTILVLKQKNGWTYGALANQVWSVAGDEERNDVNQLYAQPFCGYNWKSGAGITVDSEITHNWETKNTSAYLVPQIATVTKLGKQMVQLFLYFQSRIGDLNTLNICLLY